MEFLHFSSHPDFTKYITDQEFEVRIPSRTSWLLINISILQDLKNLTGKCHSHVMGDSSGTPERRQSVSPHIESEDLALYILLYLLMARDYFSRRQNRQVFSVKL